jgi:biotin-(acetyl-CoA carboxylase) ligase
MKILIPLIVVLCGCGLNNNEMADTALRYRMLYIENRQLVSRRNFELQKLKTEYDMLYSIFLREKEKKEDYRDAMMSFGEELESCKKQNSILKNKIKKAKMELPND